MQGALAVGLVRLDQDLRVRVYGFRVWGLGFMGLGSWVDRRFIREGKNTWIGFGSNSTC